MAQQPVIKTFYVFGKKIVITLSPTGGGSIFSELQDTTNYSVAKNRMIDGVESLILAHACEGIDVTSTPYVMGIETCIDAILNR